jgi:hypothetical protein
MGDFGQNPMANQGSGWSAPKAMGGGGGPPVRQVFRNLSSSFIFSSVVSAVHQWVVGDLGVHQEAGDSGVHQEAEDLAVLREAASEVLPVDSEGAALAEAILHAAEVVSVAVSEAEDAAGENRLRPMSVCFR